MALWDRLCDCVTVALWVFVTVALCDSVTVALWDNRLCDCVTVALWVCMTVALWDCGTVALWQMRQSTLRQKWLCNKESTAATEEKTGEEPAHCSSLPDQPGFKESSKPDTGGDVR